MGIKRIPESHKEMWRNAKVGDRLPVHCGDGFRGEVVVSHGGNCSDCFFGDSPNDCPNDDGGFFCNAEKRDWCYRLVNEQAKEDATPAPATNKVLPTLNTDVAKITDLCKKIWIAGELVAEADAKIKEWQEARDHALAEYRKLYTTLLESASQGMAGVVNPENPLPRKRGRKDGGGLRQEILGLMDATPMKSSWTPGEIKAVLPCKNSTSVDARLTGLVKDGSITRLGYGLYRRNKPNTAS